MITPGLLGYCADHLGPSLQSKKQQVVQSYQGEWKTWQSLPHSKRSQTTCVVGLLQCVLKLLANKLHGACTMMYIDSRHLRRHPFPDTQVLLHVSELIVICSITARCTLHTVQALCSYVNREHIHIHDCVKWSRFTLCRTSFCCPQISAPLATYIYHGHGSCDQLVWIRLDQMQA